MLELLHEKRAEVERQMAAEKARLTSLTSLTSLTAETADVAERAGGRKMEAERWRQEIEGRWRLGSSGRLRGSR